MNNAFAFRRVFRENGVAARVCAMVLAIIAMAVIAAADDPARAGEASPPTLAVLPFEIEDTSGEVGPADRHDALLSRTTGRVRDEIAAAGLYRVVPGPLTDAAVAAVDSGTYLRRCNGCEIDIAKHLGAHYVLVGSIYKVSTLVLTLHIDIKEVSTGRPVYARVFDFRGDNERAYAHAAKTLVRSLASELPVRPGTN